MKTTIIATLLLTTLAASAQGLTGDIAIGSTTFTVTDGRITAWSGPPNSATFVPKPAPVSAPAPQPKQSLGFQRLHPDRSARTTALKPTPKTAPAVTTPVALGPVYDIDISSMSGVRITVVSTNTFTLSQLRQWLREAARTVPKQ